MFTSVQSDSSDIEQVVEAVGQSLKSFITNFKSPSTEFPATYLVYRWIGLARSQSLSVAPPENMGWLFLYMHQLIYEQTAIAFPDESGMSGKSKQQIQTIVNHDINALLTAKFGHDVLSKNDRKNNKVDLFHSYLLMFLEIYYIFVEIICVYCKANLRKGRIHFGEQDHLCDNDCRSSLCRSCYSE